MCLLKNGIRDDNVGTKKGNHAVEGEEACHLTRFWKPALQKNRWGLDDGGRLVANVVECSGVLWCPGGVGVMNGAGVEPLSAFEKGYGFENVMGARRSVLHGRRCRASSRGSEW